MNSVLNHFIDKSTFCGRKMNFWSFAPKGKYKSVKECDDANNGFVAQEGALTYLAGYRQCRRDSETTP